MEMTAHTLYCRAGSSANNLALLNFEYLSIYLSIYLSMCVRFGMQSIHCPRPLRIPCIQHATTWMHDGGIFCREEPAFSASQRHRAQQRRGSSRHSQRLASQCKGSVKHGAMSKSLHSSERRYASFNTT